MYGGSWTGDGVYCKMGRDGDGGDGNLKGWESARAWVGDGKSSVSSCQAESARAVSNVPQGVGAPDPRPRRSGCHGISDVSIRFENSPRFLVYAYVSPFSIPPQNTIGPLWSAVVVSYAGKIIWSEAKFSTYAGYDIRDRDLCRYCLNL
jgi:hypothetical protein